jgi:hypothetical protein
VTETLAVAEALPEADALAEGLVVALPLPDPDAVPEALAVTVRLFSAVVEGRALGVAAEEGTWKTGLSGAATFHSHAGVTVWHSLSEAVQVHLSSGQV